MRNAVLICLLISFFSHEISAQKKSFKVPDSLKTKSFDYLDGRIYELRRDTAAASIYLYAYLHKARKQRSFKETVNAYKNFMHQAPPELKPTYADSMIYEAQKSNNDALIGSAYLSKGILHYGNKKLGEALDNYLTASRYISRTDDQYLTYKAKYHIALVKFYIGYYDEAASLFQECIANFKDHPRPYLNSLHCLGITYNRSGNYGMCSQTNALSLEECERLEIPEMKPYFIHSEGINSYFLKNYRKAAAEIQSSLPGIQSYDDFAYISIGNFYIGKSHVALDEMEKALPHFIKVDEIFNLHNYLRADLREVYEILIKYYKGRNDLEKQLYYIDQLLKADKLLYETNKYLISKIHKEYDTADLMNQKKQISEELLRERQNRAILIAAFIALFTFTLFLLYRHYKNRAIYKKNFDMHMKTFDTDSKNKAKIKTGGLPISGINSDTVAEILKLLDKFENDKKYLVKDWNQGTLAAYLNTNVRYIAGIISHYRDKGFNEYINELRIDYIISLLHKDAKYRKYSNNALAEEAGFSTTQRFSFAFKAKTGMPVNYFIEQLTK